MLIYICKYVYYCFTTYIQSNQEICTAFAVILSTIFSVKVQSHAKEDKGLESVPPFCRKFIATDIRNLNH